MKAQVLVAEKIAVSRIVAEAVVVGFLGAMTLLAHASGLALLLFPELAALSHDVMTRPKGKWASHPWQLVLTPTITAVLGSFFTTHLPYSAWSVALIVALSLVVIRVTKSTIAPAISAGALPMIIGERSWLYPVAIFLGLGMLVVLLLMWQKLMVGADEENREESRVLDAMEELPRDRLWWLMLMVFVGVVGMVAQWTGLRLLLFPPLIVMAYELFGHTDVPGWIRRPVLFPVACGLTAVIGLVAWRTLPEVLAVMVAVVGSIVVLRGFEVHMPPALAVGLLPFVMHAPDYRFVLSVLGGTVVLTLYYLGYRGWSRRWAV